MCIYTHIHALMYKYTCLEEKVNATKRGNSGIYM